MTTTAPEASTTSLLFNGSTFATAWRSVALASAKEKDANPVLNRTIAIERFPAGVRLIATDSHVLLHGWVPTFDHGWEELTSNQTAPDFDEAPLSTTVAQDPHGRAVGLMAHVLNLTAPDSAPPVDVRVIFGGVESEEGAMLDRPVIGLEIPDTERLLLPVVEADFPDWRTVLAGFDPQITDAIALSPEILGQLSKLGDFHGNRPIKWRFGGDLGMALLEVIGAVPPVAGAVMPMRIESNEPAVAPEDDETEGDSE